MCDHTGRQTDGGDVNADVSMVMSVFVTRQTDLSVVMSVFVTRQTDRLTVVMSMLKCWL